MKRHSEDVVTAVCRWTQISLSVAVILPLEVVTGYLPAELSVHELFRRLAFHAGPSSPPRSTTTFEEVVEQLLAR